MGPSKEILFKITNKWKLSRDLEFIRKVENWIYKDAQNKLFIRITDPSHRSLGQINSELHWIFHLGTKGVEFAHPIKSYQGHLVEQVSCGPSHFYVSVFKEARGRALAYKEDFT